MGVGGRDRLRDVRRRRAVLRLGCRLDVLTANGRHTFRDRLSLGEAAWARGRGWALWKTLAACAYDLSKADEEGANAWRILGEIFAEYEAFGR